MSAGTPTSPSFPHGIGAAPGSPRSRPRTPNSAPGAIGAMGGTSLEDGEWSKGYAAGRSTPKRPSEASLHFQRERVQQLISRLHFFTSTVHRWTSADVGMWLQSSRLGTHADLFAQNDIVGAVLLDVDQPTLKQMGITNVGDRIRIFSAIKALKKRCADSIAAQHAAASAATLAPPHDGEMEYLDHDLASSNHNARSGFASPGQTSRRHQQSRPPPLHLTQSSYGVTPAPISPNGPGLGLSAARGLTPGGSRMGNPANNGTGRSPAVNKRALPASSSSQGFSSREQSPPSLHRKVNSAGAPTTSSFGQPSRPAPRPPVVSHVSRPSNVGASIYSHTGPNRNGQSSSPTSSSFNPHMQSSRPLAASGVAGNAPPLTPINESYMRTPTLSHHPSGSMTGYNLSRGGSFGGSSSSRSGSQTRQLSTGSFDPPMSGSVSSYSLYDSTSGPPSWDSASTYAQPFSLEDVKRRTIKFIGEDGTTRTVPVSDCRDAYDVMTRVLRKFNKPASGNSYTPTAGQHENEDVDWNDTGDVTWSIFATSADGQMKALTDQELLAICHAPQPHDPLRERGLVLQRLNTAHDSNTVRRPIRTGRNKLEAFFGERMPGQGQGSPREADSEGPSVVTTSGKKMKRASTVSIMSGLGVSLVNKVGKGSGRNNLAAPTGLQPEPPTVAPRKARNFTGQRPPSELISSHLADYFPTAEKKVLERTARRSVYGRASMSTRSKRDSTWSFTADPDAPPIPGKESIESARGFDKKPIIQIGYDQTSSSDSAASFGHLQPPSTYSNWGPPTLPPVVGRSSLEDWSSSLQTAGSPTSEQDSSLRQSSSGRRTSGESARSRKSLASQIRRGLASARERGDAASLLTVDEITQEVENRRESTNLAGAGGGWVVDEDGVPIPVPRSSRNAGSLAPSTRPSSGLSGPVDSEDEDDLDDGLSHRPGRGNSPVPSAPGEESNRHRGDPYAVSRDTTSRASSVSELRKSLSDHDGDDEDFEDGLSDDDEEDDDEEDEEDLGVVPRGGPAGKAPIKWIKGALIGAGSFGNVFLGMNAKNGLLMAVKQVEIPSGDSQKDKRKMSMLEALEREIELLKTMQHENIVQYLDSYGDGVHLNIFLEYVPGGSVVTLLRNYGAFEEELVRIWVRQILQGLSYLHGRDIVHRDIKGANILVDTTGGVKISDFGISKKVESDLLVSARSHRPSLQGSVFWMAPEVVKQTSYTRKADIWSLGCLIVEMISGTHPWATLNQMQALFKIGSSSKPAIPDDVSADAITFLNKTFEIDHNLRPSADELLLEPFITDELVVDDVPSPATAQPPNGGSAASAGAFGESTVGTAGVGTTLNGGSATLATTTPSSSSAPPKVKGAKAQARKGKSVEALGAASKEDASIPGATNGNGDGQHANTAQSQADYERTIATQSSLLGGGVGLL